MKKIFASQVKLGMTLPCDVYTEQGVLLWTQGSTVKTEQQAKKLVSEGYRSGLQEWVPAKTGSRVSGDDVIIPGAQHSIQKVYVYPTVLDALMEINIPLLYIFGVFKTDSFFKEKQPLTAQIDAVVDVILDICSKHPSEALGTVNMYSQGKYATLVAMHRAIVATLICVASRQTKQRARSIAAAALTSQSSIIKLIETVRKQSKILPQQQKEINESTSESLLFLTRCGVRDEAWLDAVYMHKEHLDGSGMPRQLKGDQIPLEARILAIADTYVSYIMPEHQMAPRHDPVTAMIKLVKRNNGALDAGLISDFVKLFGAVPPGTFVHIKNGGIGIVVRKRRRDSSLLVAKIGEDLSDISTKVMPPMPASVESAFKAPSELPKKLFRIWREEKQT